MYGAEMVLISRLVSGMVIHSNSFSRIHWTVTISAFSQIARRFILLSIIREVTFHGFVLASNGDINEFKMDGQDISVVNYSLCDDTQVSKSTDCLVMMPPKCEERGNFSEIRGLMPNSMVVNWSIHTGLSDCELICSSNCSCTAYASLHDDGTGCELITEIKVIF